MVKIYTFHDEWEINAPLNAAWDSISDSADWTRWWPGLKSAVITNQDPNIIGSSVELIWRSKTGYHLRHRITIITMKPKKLIEFTSDGDLTGHGSWSFREAQGKTYMVIEWNVQTTRAWMNVLSVFLSPIFTSNHNSLMKQGEAGLNKYLQNIKM